MTTESSEKQKVSFWQRKSSHALIAFLTVVVVLAWQADVFSSKLAAGEVDETRPETGAEETVEVQRQAVPRRRLLVGAVAPQAEVELAARISGRIVELPVEEGSRISKGELVAALEQSVPQAARDEAAAGVAMAEAELRGADQLLNHIRQAVEARTMPQTELVGAERTRDAAARAVERSRAALEAASARLNFTRIESPSDGIVFKTLKDAGDQVMPGQPVLVMYDPRLLEIAVHVPEKLADHFAQGARASCRIEALGVELDARVRVLIPGADPASRTMLAKLEVELPPEAVPGMYGRISFVIDSEKLLLVPGSAVGRVRQLDFVRVVGPADRISRRIVRLGRSVGDEFVVLAGLRPGERIIRRISADAEAVQSANSPAPPRE